MTTLETVAKAVAAAASSTLFGDTPYQTTPPTQGSFYFYKDPYCQIPLEDAATPLIFGQCQNAPIPGIRAVTVNSLPTCPDFGTPFLVVSDRKECKNSTSGSNADVGQIGSCSAISSGVDVGSVQFECFGNGIASIPGTRSSTAGALTPTVTVGAGYTPYSGSTSDGSDDDSGCCDDCCCVVM